VRPPLLPVTTLVWFLMEALTAFQLPELNGEVEIVGHPPSRSNRRVAQAEAVAINSVAAHSAQNLARSYQAGIVESLPNTRPRRRRGHQS
jgi:hypothetical protein